MAGIKFVYSAVNDPAVLHDLMIREGVTDSAGVPTVWLAMFQHLRCQRARSGRRSSRRSSAARPRRAS
jgi:hypothetical protein